MNKLTSCLIFIMSFCSVSANETLGNPQNLNEVLISSSISIEDVSDSKIYLQEDKLWFFQGQWYIQNNVQQWIPLAEAPIQEGGQFYVVANEGNKCPLGHAAIARSHGTYYCLKPRCPYNVSNIP